MATKFIFLVLPEVHLLDLAGPNQVISECIDLGADFEIEYCGTDPEVKSSSNLGINKLKHFSKVKPRANDYIIIPGSRLKFLQSSFLKSNKTLLTWLIDVHQKQVNLVSICVGSFVLAEAGLLNHIQCTTHFQVTQELKRKYPAANVKDDILFTYENNIYTSAGIASGIDLMLHIIEKHTDGHFAHKIARELVVYKRREGIHEQHSIHFQCREHMHSGVHRVQDFIIDNVHKKLNLQTLADLASMSERNFSRIFKKETGITVHDYITRVRVEQIKDLVKNPDLSRKQIARKVGLQSEKQIGRLLQHVG